MIDVPGGIRSLGDVEMPTLPIAKAEAMDDGELEAIFIEIVMDLVLSFGADEMPAGFPCEPYGMKRAEILAAVRKYQYWFDPDGGHPKPTD